MANDADARSHHTLAATLGALGPGGTAAITFEDYTRLFGSEPSEDELEGRRVRKFAADNACDHSVDHGKKRVWFRKK
jgi:hypothetical protein